MPNRFMALLALTTTLSMAAAAMAETGTEGAKAVAEVEGGGWFLPVMIGIGGIVIGALLTAGLHAIGFFFKERSERNKTLRRAVSHLLRIWRAVYSMDNKVADRFDEMTQRKCKEAKLFSTDETERAKNKKRVAASYRKGRRALLPFTIDGLADQFKVTVEELAEYFPVLAAGLSMKTNAVEAIERAEELLEKQLSDYSEGEQDQSSQELLATMKEKLWETFLKETTDGLEKDVIVLAEKAGKATLKECEKHIKEVRRKAESKDEVMEKTFDGIISLAKNTLPPA